MLVKLIKFAMALCLVAAPAWAGTTVGTVMVRPASEVVLENVNLGDIAAVEATDGAMAETLQSIPICRAPLPGRTRQITRAQVVVALRRHGLADESVELLSPSRIAISRASSTITGQTLFATAEEFLLSAEAWPGTVIVEPVRLPPDQTAPVGDIDLRVRTNGLNVRKGRNSIPVEIVVDDCVHATISVSVLVRLFASVLVSTQSIARSDEITTINTTLERRDITNLPSDLVFEQPAEAEASVPITEGATIRQNWISEPMAIRSGDTVTVVAAGRSVRVADKGTAVADGRPGERIKVRLLGDVREVHGTVAGPGLVEIRVR